MSSVTWRADHVHAQDLVGRGVGDDLDEAARVAVDDGLAAGLEGELADLRGQAARLALRAGQTDRGDLRPRVGGSRHLHVVDRLDLLAGDGVHRRDALVRGDVRQPEAADDVADGVEVRVGRAHLAVDLDEARVERPPCVVSRPDVLGVGGAPGGHEQLLGAQLGRRLALLADHEPDARLVRLDRRRVEASAAS